MSIGGRRQRSNVDAVIVATDDARIAEAVARFGGEVRLTRPTHATGTDRIAEVAAALDCDLIVNLQGDEPLIEPAAIDAGDRALPKRCRPGHDVALSALPR